MTDGVHERSCRFHKYQHHETEAILSVYTKNYRTAAGDHHIIRISNHDAAK